MRTIMFSVSCALCGAIDARKYDVPMGGQIPEWQSEWPLVESIGNVCHRHKVEVFIDGKLAVRL